MVALTCRLQKYKITKTHIIRFYMIIRNEIMKLQDSAISFYFYFLKCHIKATVEWFSANSSKPTKHTVIVCPVVKHP